jgi:hypothetical protein
LRLGVPGESWPNENEPSLPVSIVRLTEALELSVPDRVTVTPGIPGSLASRTPFALASTNTVPARLEVAAKSSLVIVAVAVASPIVTRVASVAPPIWALESVTVKFSFGSTVLSAVTLTVTVVMVCPAGMVTSWLVTAV